jgi:hypothetical protein
MKTKLEYAVAALLVLALSFPTLSLAASFGSQNFFSAPGNVITPLAGFTTSWSSGGGAAYPFPLTGNATSTLTQFLGGIAATTIQATSTATSTIANLNTVLYVPPNFATAGCAGNPSYTDFGTCVNALYSLASTSGNYALEIVVPAIKVTQAQWQNQINFNGPAIVSFDCVEGAQLEYGGYGTSTIFNMANPTGHLVSDDYGCLYMGQPTLIAAGNTNAATTTGIGFGGSHGAVGVDFHDNSLNGFGKDFEVGPNAYMLTFQGNSVSGGDGTTTFPGSLGLVDPANNSGERLNLGPNNNFIDPGNLFATSSIFISASASASTFICGNSLDDAGISIGISDGLVSVCQNHIENSDSSGYGAYIPVVGSSAQSTMIDFTGNFIANDSSTQGFFTIIKHGNNLYAAGNFLDNYAGGTVNLFSDHSLNNGSESETLCDTQVQGGTLSSLVSNQTWSQAVGNSCISDQGNSYPLAFFTQSSNVANFRNGNGLVGTIDSLGNWNFGISGTNSTATFANGTITSGGTLTINGTGNSPFAGSVTVAKTVGIGTTTELAALQATVTTANATTSVEFGKANQTKGTCMTLFDQAGAPVYFQIAPGATTFTVQNGGTAPSGCND